LGPVGANHNESRARDARGLTVRTGGKAGALGHNHNETAVQAAGLKVQTGVKAGKVGGIK
jgi:hypothetical protein